MRHRATVGTLIELAARLGVAERTVERWKSAGMPVERSGRYHVERIATWREETTSRNRERSGLARHGLAEVSRDAEQERRRHRDRYRTLRTQQILLANRAREFEIRCREAQLVHRADVARLLRERFAWFRSKLAALAGELALPIAEEADPVRIQRIIEDAVLRVFEDAYQHVPAGSRD